MHSFVEKAEWFFANNQQQKIYKICIVLSVYLPVCASVQNNFVEQLNPGNSFLHTDTYLKCIYTSMLRLSMKVISLGQTKNRCDILDNGSLYSC